MAVRYAKFYINRLCESCDVFELHVVVRTLDAERDFEDPF